MPSLALPPLAGDAILLAIAAGASGLAQLAARRRERGSPSRRGWRLVELALVAQSAGMLVQLIEGGGGGGAIAHPSPADACFIVSYPSLLAGVLSFASTRRSRRQSLELALDVGIVSLGGMTVAAFVVASDMAPEGAIEILATVGYALGMAALAIAFGVALLRETSAQTRASLQLTAVSAALFFAGDLASGQLAHAGAQRAGAPVQTLYALALACLGAAAARQRAGADEAPRVASRATCSRWASLPYVAMSGILAGLLVVTDGRPLLPDLSVIAIVIVSGAMVVARQMLHQRNLRQSHLHLAQAQEIAQVGSYEWDVVHDVFSRSEEDLRLYGLDAADAPANVAQSLALVHPDDRERVEQLLAKSLQEGKSFSYEMRIVRPDGEVRTVLSRGQVECHGGRATLVHGTHQDVTERRRIEEQMRRESEHDALTGLFNRAKLTRELERTLQYAARYRRQGALLTLDVDDFHLVNDTLGHSSGDELLKTLADAILRRVRTSDVVARLGGDEFAILLPEAETAEALAIAKSLARQAPADLRVPNLRLSGAVVPFDGDRAMVADEVLSAADIALYEAKEAGKDRVCVYRGRAGAPVTWVQSLRKALTDGRLELYAQPIVDLRRGTVTHHELLLRMHGEDGQLVGPDRFIPAAERFGLIGEIDRWVVRQGLRVAGGGRGVSINLSARSIGDTEILAAVRSAIASGLDGSHVIFEITETAAMENMQEAREFTEALVALGCAVAIDDFGTGFGSFTYLKYLPARYLKIDTEFVRDMVHNETDRQVVDAITRVAHSLDKLTIAEGVEDDATLRALREHDVDGAQGFHIGRPSPLYPSVPARPRRVPAASARAG